jgi:hypothetical protein
LNKLRPAKQCSTPKTAAPAAANQSTGQDQTRQAVFFATLLVFVVVHVLALVIAAAEAAGERETGKTATPAAANQPPCQRETRQAVLVTTLLVFFVVVLVLSFKNFAGECDTGETAAAHSSSKKNLSQMTLLSITVQAVMDFLILRHRFSFHHVFGKTRHVTDIARTCQFNGQLQTDFGITRLSTLCERLESVTRFGRRGFWALLPQQLAPHQATQDEFAHAAANEPAACNATDNDLLEIVIVRLFFAVAGFEDVTIRVGKAGGIGLLKNREQIFDVIVADQRRKIFIRQFVFLAGLVQGFNLDDFVVRDAQRYDQLPAVGGLLCLRCRLYLLHIGSSLFTPQMTPAKSGTSRKNSPTRCRLAAQNGADNWTKVQLSKS